MLNIFKELQTTKKRHAKIELEFYNELINGEKFGDTKENLKIAIAGESYENTTMYPDFAEIAKDEGFDKIAKKLSLIGKIEIEHENMYKELLERLESGKEFESDDVDEEWICEVCGHVHRGKKSIKDMSCM